VGSFLLKDPLFGPFLWGNNPLHPLENDFPDPFTKLLKIGTLSKPIFSKFPKKI